MIRSILFDLGNVLVPFEIRHAYEQLSARSGKSAEEVAALVRESGLYPEVESGRLEPAEFQARFCELLGFECSAAEFREIWNSIFLPHTATSEELIVDLKERYRLVLLSNTNDLHFGWLSERYPILRHFDAYTLSYKVGAMKPSPLIYQAAVDNAQCKPEECFFTDDVVAYVEGAREFGIDAEVFVGEERLKGYLRERGLIR